MSKGSQPKKLKQPSITDCFGLRAPKTDSPVIRESNRTKRPANSKDSPTETTNSSKSKAGAASPSNAKKKRKTEVELTADDTESEAQEITEFDSEDDMSMSDDRRYKLAEAAERRRRDGTPDIAIPPTPTESDKESRDPAHAQLQKKDSALSAASTSTVEVDDPDIIIESDPEFDALLEREATMLSQAQKLTEVNPSKGVPIADLYATPTCSLKLPPLRGSDAHQVLVKVPLNPAADFPAPWPDTYRDHWDNVYVKMPCSPENIYPVSDETGKKSLRRRWDMIQDSLLQPMTSTIDIEEAILTFNSRYTQKWNFTCMHRYFTEVLSREETQLFFDKTFPNMVRLALALPVVCTQPPKLLRRGTNSSVTLSQYQVAALLANAFFCTFPRRNARQKHSEYSSYPSVNFNTLFFDTSHRKDGRKKEKLKCIVNYFQRVTDKIPEGTVTFTRRALHDTPSWETSDAPLTRLHVTSTGTIEDHGTGMLQVDFANKFVGGGVLGHGCVQEEIRFLLCPEMILSRLITEELGRSESLLMIGCERYSNYEGYGDSFRWTGDHVDNTPRDEWGRRQTEVVAIDALVFHNYRNQFRYTAVERELNKAYSGFHSEQSTNSRNLPAVATGNWGCGAFGGDHRLKALIQLMACAQARRDVCYFTFGDRRLRDDLHHIHTFLTDKGLHVADLLAFIHQYEGCISHSKGRTSKDLFQFILSVYEDTGSDVTDTNSCTESNSHPDDEANTVPDSPDYAANTP